MTWACSSAALAGPGLCVQFGFLCAGSCSEAPCAVCAVGRVAAAGRGFALQLLPALWGGGLSPAEAGPPPSALSVWPLQNLTPFRPGFHPEGKEDEEVALVAPVGTLGRGKTVAANFWPLKAPSSLSVNTWAWYLRLRASVNHLLSHSSSLWAPSGTCWALGPSPPLPTDLAWAPPPNKGTPSSCALCPVLGCAWIGGGNALSLPSWEFSLGLLCHLRRYFHLVHVFKPPLPRPFTDRSAVTQEGKYIYWLQITHGAGPGWAGVQVSLAPGLPGISQALSAEGEAPITLHSHLLTQALLGGPTMPSLPSPAPHPWVQKSSLTNSISH